MRIVYHLRNYYERSPDFIRNSVGSLIGKLPSGWRYGSAFEKTRKQLLISQTWNAEAYEQYQLIALRDLLGYAKQRVPYYRRVFNEIDFDPQDLNSTKEISQLPILTREMVREHEDDLLAEGLATSSYKYSTTGGTTGKPLGFYITHDASASEWAFMLQNWHYAGFKPGDKRAVFRGSLIEEGRAGKLWQHDPVNQALLFPSFNLSDTNLSRYVEVMQKYRPDFLHAYPSSATLIAQFLERTRKSIPSLRGILVGSENIYPDQRDYLEAVFKTKVFTWYGHSEKSILAGGCQSSNVYHVFPEYGITELVNRDGDSITEPGERGLLVGTGFINRATVFIRYLTDDEAEWAPSQCGCGRNTARLKNIRGRWNQEMLIGKSGALISMTAINLHSSAYTAMHQFQFHQIKPGEATLRIVKNKNYNAEDEQMILGELNSKLKEEIQLQIEYVSQIPLSPAGKHKFIDQHVQINYPNWNNSPGEISS